MTIYGCTPGSLNQAIDTFENDHKFLIGGGVFTDNLVEMWVKLEHKEGFDHLAFGPHPYEFYMHYGS